LLLSVRERPTTVAGIICIVAAVTTVSRSTLLGGALGIVLFALQTRGSRLRIVAITIVLVLSALVVVNSVPALKRSFDQRVLDINQSQVSRQESVRVNSLSIFKDELNVNPSRILLGGGVGYSTKLLTERGGNAAGYDIFDNEYITMMYDGGFIVVLCVFGLLAVAVIKSGKLGRQQGLPALAAVAVVMYFVDGMEWPSLSVVAWMAIGLFTVPLSSQRSAASRRWTTTLAVAKRHSAPRQQTSPL
jgi:O-antigen ligase